MRREKLIGEAISATDTPKSIDCEMAEVRLDNGFVPKIPRIILDTILEQNINDPTANDKAKIQEADHSDEAEKKHFLVSANDKSVILNYRQALVLSIGLMNQGKKLNLYDFISAGLKFNRATITVRKFVEQVNNHLSKIDIPEFFKIGGFEDGKKIYIANCPEGIDINITEYTMPQSGNKKNKITDPEENIEDPRPDYLKQSSENLKAMQTKQSPWGNSRIKWVYISLGALQTMDIKSALADRVNPNSLNPRHPAITIRQAGEVVQAYFIAYQKPPSLEDENDMEILENTSKYINAFIRNYLAREVTFLVTEILKKHKINENTVLDESSQDARPISTKLKIMAKNDILKMLGELDLSNIFGSQERFFNDKVRKKMELNLVELLK